MKDRTWKLLDLLNEASGFFSSRDVDNPRLQAEWLLSAALGVRRLDLYLQFDKILSPGEVEIFRGFVRRRLSGEPLQYITGEAAFRFLELEVNPTVLIPRPETETLVDAALELLSERKRARVLDPGAGSGAIGVAIASEHADAHVTATDIDLEALALARVNAERCNVADRMRFLCGDLFEPLSDTSRFDAIVCNPPYIRTADLAGLDTEVRDYEPQRALDGGEDGLDFYRRIAAGSMALLAPDSHLLLEVGFDQADDVVQLLQLAGYEDVQTRADLAAVQRVVTARSR